MDLDVDGDGRAEMVVRQERPGSDPRSEPVLDLFLYHRHTGGWTRVHLLSFPALRDTFVAALARDGLGVIVVMDGSSHSVQFRYVAVAVGPRDARVIGTLASTDSLDWVSLANVDRDAEPEVVVVQAAEADLASATVTVYDHRGTSMQPLRHGDAARRRFAVRYRAAALAGDPDAERVMTAMDPGDWQAQAAIARRAIAADRPAEAHVMWTLADAPPSERWRLATEFDGYDGWSSWPYGLYFEAFECDGHTSGGHFGGTDTRWTVDSSCLCAAARASGSVPARELSCH